MIYKVGVVGESHYQSTIRKCRIADPVSVLRERGNPYDELALVVKTDEGAKLGYIGRDCWLQDAIHNEGKGCAAVIFDLVSGEHGTGVVISVMLAEEGVGECDYQD